MNNLPIRDHLDHLDPSPQIVGLGRVHRLEIEIYVSANASPEQIEEAVSVELGSGGIGPDSPLYNGNWTLKDCTHIRDTGLNGFELWDAKGEHEPGRRSGKTVHRRDGEPLGWECGPVSPQRMEEGDE